MSEQQMKASAAAPVTTTQRTIVPEPLPPDAAKILPFELAKYEENGYGRWTYGPGLAPERRLDLLPAGRDAGAGGAGTKLLRFFTFTDIHIADVQSPAQAIFFGYHGFLSSAYSGVMLYTHHVLDAAVRTVNALHREEPIDFGISLGDTCNNTQYNELRWYIDVLDGGRVDPDSGVRLPGGDAPRAAWLDAYQAAGLDPSLPWYQTRGNHDHFWTGFLRVDDYLRAAYTGETILDLGNVFEDPLGPDSRGFYMGCLDGRTPHGDIFGIGPVAGFAEPPKVLAADPDRRSLTKSEWMQEFFTTSSALKGHGFDETAAERGFACYTFEPRADVPVRVLVLDDTQRDDDPWDYGYGHASLDKERRDWLFAELDRGQADGMLLIVAAHCPVGIEKPPAPMSWASSAFGTEEELFAKLHGCPNLVLWVAGHRHRNVVTPFPSPDPERPELGFWEVETASLRDFPQQFRTIELVRESEDTLTIRAIDVDPAIEEGSAAATSRKYGVAAHVLFKNDLEVGYAPAGVYNADLVVPLSEGMRRLLDG
jgi:metallophosphoesterase (TIGR03768 family)